MKHILTLILILSVSIAVNAQLSKLDAIFDKYQDTEGVTSIKIAKPMFNMLKNLDIDDADFEKIKPLTNSINAIKMLIIEDSFPELSKNILDAVKALNYEELMTVNSHDSKIKFLSANNNSNDKIISNLVLSIVSGKENILMYLDGKLNIDDVSKLVNDNE